MRIILLITIVIVAQNLSAQIQESTLIFSEKDIDINTYTGTISETYGDGKPSLWKQMVNGKANGLWLEWYPNGKLRYNATWKENKGHGRWEYYYPNGQLRSESFYIDDITQGILRSYHANGQVKTDLTYIDGRREGLALEYDENGMIISRKKYEADNEVFDEPTLFDKGNISNEKDNEWGITFTPNGQKAYFTRRDHETDKKRIMQSNYIDGKWSKPTKADFSNHEDESPFITQDGSTMLFSSYRPIDASITNQKMDMNLWQMKKENNTWTTPKPLSSAINHTVKMYDEWPKNYEAGPVTDPAGNLYYWTKGNTTQASNIYIAKKNRSGIYGTPSELKGPSNDKYFDTSPCFTSDGKLMIFSSDDRADGYGNGDLYYARKINGKWSEATNLGPIVNTYRSEGFPSISPDGKYLFFSSTRGGALDSNGEALWDIYYMETRYLLIK